MVIGGIIANLNETKELIFMLLRAVTEKLEKVIGVNPVG